MKKPLRKDFPSHQAWVAAMDKFNAARPKRKDYKTHAEWVTALDLFNKNSKPDKTVKKDKPIERNIKSINNTNYDINTEAGKKAYEKALADSKKNENKNNNQNNEKKENNNNNKLKIKSTTEGGPVKDGVEYAKSKGDDLAGYRRQKDTRITKKLKKAGFTEDRLARLRKKNAEFQAAKKDKKKMKAYREKYGKR